MADKTISTVETDQDAPTIEVTEITVTDESARNQEHRAHHRAHLPHQTHEHAVIHPASGGASHLNPGGVRFGR